MVSSVCVDVGYFSFKSCFDQKAFYQRLHITYNCKKKRRKIQNQLHYYAVDNQHDVEVLLAAASLYAKLS